MSAAGRTFHVGSSKLTLKLFRVSELSVRAVFGGTGVFRFGESVSCVPRDFSGGVEDENCDCAAENCDCPLRE